MLFLSEPPDARATQILESFASQSDQFRVHGREVYWLRHLDVNGAAYTTVPLDQALSAPFTIRSMSTVRRIVEKFFSHE